MKFELTTLDEYTDEALLAELRRVAEIVDTPKLSIIQFSSLAKVHGSTLKRRFGGWRNALARAGLSHRIDGSNIGRTREEILRAIAKAVQELQRAVLTLDEFQAHTGISGTSVRRCFGSWERALTAAGLSQSLLGRRYTDEECFENILALWTHYGRQPKFGELKRSPSAVGPKAYTRRWGGWRAALSAFVKRVNEPQEQPVQPVEPKPNTTDGTTPTEAAPRSISLSLRYRVLVRDSFRCVACGASPAKDVAVELHVDHIFPWSRGGQNTEDNLRTLCFKCNLGKGARIEDAQPRHAADSHQRASPAGSCR